MLTNVRFEDLKNIENVKTAVEHISLYVGLVVFTALGAKVGFKNAGYIKLRMQLFRTFLIIVIE